jgi:hypothetical protein
MTYTRAFKCLECGFYTDDENLMRHHSCDIQLQGGACEDYPACGHEWGDCNGLLYGSDEAIKADAMAHSMCDHENGVYECEDRCEEDDDEEG